MVASVCLRVSCQRRALGQIVRVLPSASPTLAARLALLLAEMCEWPTDDAGDALRGNVLRRLRHENNPRGAILLHNLLAGLSKVVKASSQQLHSLAKNEHQLRWLEQYVSLRDALRVMCAHACSPAQG